VLDGFVRSTCTLSLHVGVEPASAEVAGGHGKRRLVDEPANLGGNGIGKLATEMNALDIY
jgi:hypothetical protein